MNKIYLIALIILTFLNPGKASHIVGGEFSMTYSQKGFNYDLRLNLYYDDENAGGTGGVVSGLVDPTILVAIYDKETDELVSSHELVLESFNEFVPYINPDCQIQELRTRILRYRKVISLSPTVYNNNDGYYVVYDRCCRNMTIDNINDPESTGMMFYMHFPTTNLNGSTFRDDTPVFSQPFAEYACVGQNFSYDFSATDNDGDSLVYYMDDPYNGNNGLDYPLFTSAPFPHSAPFATVQWINGFHADSAVPGNPEMGINSQTGWLNITPNTQGLFVFSVTVDQYRDGVKIGSVKRDFQILVRPPCDPNVKPSIVLFDADSTLYSEGDTVFVDGTNPHQYDLCYTDSLVNGQLSFVSVSPTALNFPSSNFSVTNTTGVVNFNGDTIKSKVIWDPCADSEGEGWNVRFIAQDNGCVLPLSDTLFVTFVVVPKSNTDPFPYTSLSVDTLQLEVWHDTTFTVFGEDADNDLIVLNANGVGFSMNDLGMSFPTVQGLGSISSIFSWYAECEDLKQKYFTVEFKVDDKWCGQTNDSIIQQVIEVFETPLIPVPYDPINVFTPNGDGVNDYFEMPELPVEKCDGEFVALEVYNRWGARVYTDNRREFKWDAANLSTGMYYYHILYENKVFKGWLQLLR